MTGMSNTCIDCEATDARECSDGHYRCGDCAEAAGYCRDCGIELETRALDGLCRLCTNDRDWFSRSEAAQDAHVRRFG